LGVLDFGFGFGDICFRFIYGFGLYGGVGMRILFGRIGGTRLPKENDEK
jgi:hypothetical protein